MLVTDMMVMVVFAFAIVERNRGMGVILVV